MTWAILVAVVVFVGTLVSLETGFRWGNWTSARRPGLSHEGVGAIEASAFALLGLLLGFSFSGATSRLESKRGLIVSEAGAIGTAYLRLDLLPADAQPPLRAEFKRMVEARVSAYDDRRDPVQAQRDFAVFAEAQQRIWSLAVTAAAAAPRDVAVLVLPPINDMMDVATRRDVAFRTHLPTLIVTLLVAATILSGLLAGYAMAKRGTRSWAHQVILAAMLALTIYTVLDIDFPRFGLINIDAAYQPLVDLRRSMP